MNYEEKYNKALEIAKELMSRCVRPSDYKTTVYRAEDIESIFPELKESEDERTRKELLGFIKNWKNPNNLGRLQDYPMFTKNEEQCNKYIAWLEKQGNVDKVSYEIAEKEKYDFVSGQFIECRKSFDEFKEDTSYWFEYVGNDTYIGRSDNILNKRFHITPRQLYSLFTQQHCPKEDNANEETNAPTEYGKYVEECLNEASKHFFSEGEDKYSVADLFYAGIRCGKSWLEKQSKQSSNILWHDVSEQPEEQREIFCEWESEDEIWHDIAFYHADTKTFWDGEHQIKDVVKWAYVSEMLETQCKQKQDASYPKFDFDDVLALQCCMETVKRIQEDEELYKKLNLLHSKVYDAYHFGGPDNTDKTSCETTETAKKWAEADDYNANILKTICEEAKDGAVKGSLRDIAMNELKQWLELLKNKFSNN